MEQDYDSCPVCSKNHGQAYNGILQLRNPTDEILRFIEDEIFKEHEKGNYCIKTNIVRNGVDYYLAKSQFVRSLGKKLLQIFGGEFLETAKLVTKNRQTSKDLYRTTVLFRYPCFKKGDIVSYKGRDVKIINFAKKVYVLDLKTNKKENVRYEYIKLKQS